MGGSPARLAYFRFTLEKIGRLPGLHAERGAPRRIKAVCLGVSLCSRVAKDVVGILPEPEFVDLADHIPRQCGDASDAARDFVVTSFSRQYSTRACVSTFICSRSTTNANTSSPRSPRLLDRSLPNAQVDDPEIRR